MLRVVVKVLSYKGLLYLSNQDECLPPQKCHYWTSNINWEINLAVESHWDVAVCLWQQIAFSCLSADDRHQTFFFSRILPMNEYSREEEDLIGGKKAVSLKSEWLIFKLVCLKQ